MRTEIINISPEQANIWLSSKLENRNILDKHVNYLADEILNGRWRLTHQGIAFNENQQLIDGQHRLAAIIKTNKTIRMSVTYDVPTDRFPIIDRGMPRNLSFITNLPAFHTQIYSLLLSIAHSAANRPSPDDVVILNQSLERFVSSLKSATSSMVPYFSSAPIRSGAVISLYKGEDRDYVLNTFRKLVLQKPSDLQTLSPIALSLIKQFTRASKEERSSFSGQQARIQLYAKARMIFTKSNEQHTQLQINNTNLDIYRQELIELINKILLDAQPEAKIAVLIREKELKDKKIRDIQNQLMKERARNIDENNYILSKEARD